MSRLHELDYWDELYDRCLEDDSDLEDGNEWFISEGVRVIDKLSEIYPKEVRDKIKILDVGCGSGEFLCRLYRIGFVNLYGFDFSSKAIILAESAAKRMRYEINYLNIDLENSSILRSFAPFDVVVDKGTFDIFFSTDRVDTYNDNILPLIAYGGRFCVVSCNATYDELTEAFDMYYKIRLELEYHLRPLRTFTFGNRNGSDRTSLVFKRLKEPTRAAPLSDTSTQALSLSPPPTSELALPTHPS